MRIIQRFNFYTFNQMCQRFENGRRMIHNGENSESEDTIANKSCNSKNFFKMAENKSDFFSIMELRIPKFHQWSVAKK